MYKIDGHRYRLQRKRSRSFGAKERRLRMTRVEWEQAERLRENTDDYWCGGGEYGGAGGGQGEGGEAAGFGAGGGGPVALAAGVRRRRIRGGGRGTRRRWRSGGLWGGGWSPCCLGRGWWRVAPLVKVVVPPANSRFLTSFGMTKLLSATDLFRMGLTINIEGKHSAGSFEQWLRMR